MLGNEVRYSARTCTQSCPSWSADFGAEGGKSAAKVASLGRGAKISRYNLANLALVCTMRGAAFLKSCNLAPLRPLGPLAPLELLEPLAPLEPLATCTISLREMMQVAQVVQVPQVV